MFLACGLGSILSALLGLSPVIILGESFAGILVGGRTGLTAIFTGLLFLVVLPFAPIFTAIPLFASAPVREEKNTEVKHVKRSTQHAIFQLFFLLVYDCISIAFTGFKGFLKGLLGRYFMLSRSTSAQELVIPL